MGGAAVAVVGGGGRTGRLLVGRAAAAGHRVRALSRRPEQLALPPGAEAVRADVRDPASLPPALAGVDVVVSLLGVGRLVDARRTERLFSSGTRNLRAAMTAVGVRRLVVVSSLGVVDSPRDDWAYRLIKRHLLAVMYTDMRLMEREVLADRLQATVVRAPRLTDHRGGRTPRLSTTGEPPGRRSIPRADLARVLLDAVENREHEGRVVSVTT